MAELPNSTSQSLTSQSPDAKERRRHPRFHPHAKVQFSGGGEVAVLPIVDISAGGIRLAMTAQDLLELDIDEDVSVFLEAEDAGRTGPVYVKVEATVVRIKRSDPSHVALEFHDRQADAVERFNTVLRILQQAQSA